MKPRDPEAANNLFRKIHINCKAQITRFKVMCICKKTEKMFILQHADRQGVGGLIARESKKNARFGNFWLINDLIEKVKKILRSSFHVRLR